MRKINRESAQAFIDGRDFTKANMHVHEDNGTRRMYLHGNKIAEQDSDGLRVTLAGWPTPTTRERINGLLDLLNINKRIYPEKHAQFIGSTIAGTACEITAHEWIRI